ncbi:hypothetical protein CKJ84_05910 [Corynebacterium sp. NML 120412]|uniref:SelB domain-containing protein n=1 Tax=Corynebacterium sp. NML 120412 TaxID=2029401 RepID=UPI000BAA55FC|nr:SelB C-terminal domain-containing protein [Corynebacterium sp. NML 120412]PAT15761.1 hypothetical protein CKJ84_05910 [Corynebacterium sp. NML 120412]
MTDTRRHIPRTDALLALAQDTPLAAHALKSLARTTQDACRRHLIPPHAAESYFLALVGKGVASMTPVLNATGVVVHTNVGRAALAPEAVDALVDAAGYVDVEMDLATGRRSRNRGAGAGSEGAREVRAPRGTDSTAKSWQTEAPLRRLQNNLDPEVAERPDDLVVYGGTARAAELLRDLDSPFTASQARRVWDTTRRVAIPLLELLDAHGITRRLDGNLRALR